MSITPLSAARIAGEVGLAGGTITGGTYVAKYSTAMGKVSELEADNKKYRDEGQKVSANKTLIKKYVNEVDSVIESIGPYWDQLKNKLVDSENKSYFESGIRQLENIKNKAEYSPLRS